MLEDYNNFEDFMLKFYFASSEEPTKIAPR